MESTLQGRLRNTDLPYSKGLMPLYEAVVNSIQSIEDLAKLEDRAIDSYHIDVFINRDKQTDFEIDKNSKAEKAVVGFTIIDEGPGFDHGNWTSFNKLDSLHKEDKGCRGIGRLLWLKAFDYVLVESTFRAEGLIERRRFRFDAKSEVSSLEDPSVVDAPIKTKIELCRFREKYARATPKSLEQIALGLLEHCLWYFVRKEGVPTIRLHDGKDDKDLFDLYDEYMHTSSSTEDFQIKGRAFEITHVKIRATKKQAHILGYCAAGRLVKEENLTGKIPGLFSNISDDDGDFVYAAYLTGSYLDDKVTGQRTGFNIEDDAPEMYADEVISYSDIRSEVLPRVEVFLADSLQGNIAAGRKKLDTFVSEVAPKYRPLLSHIGADRLSIDPNIADKDLDLLLHREVSRVEQELLSQGHDIMDPKPGESEPEYRARLEHYLQTAADLKQSDLANYVMHRRVVIDLLRSAINKKQDGKFSREDLIHELIVPMRITSDDTEFKRQNLWLVDERLAFHHYLASDKPLNSNPTTSNDTGKKPDITSLRIFNNPLLVGDQQGQQASLTVVEIKRPMRKDFKAGESEEADPVLQSLGYLRRLRQGAATRDGRPIPNADRIPGFIYILADFTAHLEDCCRLHQLKRTADGLGFFGYHPDDAYNAYIQVISFDGLVTSATERNRAFFDQLGLPAR